MAAKYSESVLSEKNKTTKINAKAFLAGKRVVYYLIANGCFSAAKAVKREMQAIK